MPYTVDEKPKVQQFLSCLPFHINNRIEYDNPKTLEEAMRKENFCYEKNRKKESMSNWKAKRSNNFEQKKKGFVPNRNFRNNNTRNFPNKNFQGNKGNSQSNSNGSRNKESANNHSNYIKNNERKEPVKCWECNGRHSALVCRSKKKNVRNIHTVQEEMIHLRILRSKMGLQRKIIK